MKFRDVMKSLPKERRERIEAGARKLVAEVQLAHIREAARCTQGELAQKMHISQAAISKLEARDDMLMSTLRKYVEAAGGKLQIKIAFPTVEFTFATLGEIFRKAPVSAPLNGPLLWLCRVNGKARAAPTPTSRGTTVPMSESQSVQWSDHQNPDSAGDFNDVREAADAA